MDGKRTRNKPKAEPDPALLKLSEHVTDRLAHRNVTDEQLGYVLRHGDRIRRTGVTFVFLRRRDIPPDDLRFDCYAKLEGVVVLVAPDGTLITMYRNKSALADIRKKAKNRRPNRTWRRPRRVRPMPVDDDTSEEEGEG